jgi:hypothetical protein
VKLQFESDRMKKSMSQLEDSERGEFSLIQWKAITFVPFDYLLVVWGMLT